MQHGPQGPKAAFTQRRCSPHSMHTPTILAHTATTPINMQPTPQAGALAGAASHQQAQLQGTHARGCLHSSPLRPAGGLRLLNMLPLMPQSNNCALHTGGRLHKGADSKQHCAAHPEASCLHQAALCSTPWHMQRADGAAQHTLAHAGTQTGPGRWQVRRQHPGAGRRADRTSWPLIV
jgi:hypothetical protein